jgi:hypothetical protein
VASPVFTTQQVGATTFTDSASRTWTVTAGGITNRSVRAVVEVPSWPAEWGTSGKLVTVGLSGAGILRRLRQGASPLDSTLRRRIPSAAGLIAYWPMEDGQNSVQAYSPVAGISPMRTSGLAFASDDSLGGSAALPQVSVPASLLAQVPALPAADWGIEFVYRIDSVPASPTLMLAVNLSGGTAARVEFLVGVGVSRVRSLLADGTVLSTFDSTLNDFTGNWGRIQIYTSTSGGTVSCTAHWVIIGAGNNWFVTSAFTGTPGRITSIQGTWLATEFGTLRLGHLSVMPGPLTLPTSPYQAADTGFATETAGVRFARVCTEESIAFTTPYGFIGTAPVGPQRPNAALDLLGEVQDADVGILHEVRDVVALAYRPRRTLYNQTPALVLDYKQQQVAPPLTPQDDDQQTRNDITVNRPAGSSARATLTTGPLSTLAPPAGVGRYTDSHEVNVQTDDQLPSLAGWLLHLGTYNGVRYPQVTIYLHRNPELINAAREVAIGDRIQIVNLPVWLPPDGADLIVQGITETLGVRTWAITFMCTPAGPWTVGVVGDPVLGRVDAVGSTLAAAATSAATSLSVATIGEPWRTNPMVQPWNLRVSGEVVTVLGVGTVLSPNMLLLSDISGWTASNSTLAWDTTTVNTARGAAASMKCTPNGTSASGGANATALTDPGTVTAGATYTACGWVYVPAGWTDLQVCADWHNTVGTFLASTIGTGVAAPAGAWTFVTQTLTAPASSSRVRLRTRWGSTPAASVISYWWGVRLIPTASVASTSLQAMTVIRGVNGITKALPSGASVSLATPSIVAL